jgi:hypothetical protein
MPICIDDLKRAANIYKTRKFLLDYFIRKFGKENINRVMNPSEIMDLTNQIPQLASRVEVVPNAIDMRLQQDSISIEWNLFVFGNKRMYLGKTNHLNIANTIYSIKSGNQCQSLNGVEYGVTPKRVIQFIIRVFEKSKDGYTPWIDTRDSVNNLLKNPRMGFGYNHMNSGNFHT